MTYVVGFQTLILILKIVHNITSLFYTYNSFTYQRRERENSLPPEDDMSTVPNPGSPEKTLGEAFIEKGLLAP